MKISVENKAWAQRVFEKLDKKFSQVAERSRDKIPYNSVNGMHEEFNPEKIHRWTNGFWGGLMWLMYAQTKNAGYKQTAVRSGELMQATFNDVEKFDHDVGFIFHILYGAEYRLTGNMCAKNLNLLSSMILSGRYEPYGGFIRAWNSKVIEENGTKTIIDKDGWTIIDTMMNLPLLYWASLVTGDKRYKRIAVKHADMAMKDHIRQDGSVNHIVVHNPMKEGEVIETKAGQGCGVGSSWSRGCSWAVYGFVLSYTYTGKKEYLDTAKRCADYFIDQASKTDYLPLCDFKQPETPCYYDAIAGAVTACGLIEISKIVKGEEGEAYLNSALKLLTKLEKDCCDFSQDTDFLLSNCMQSYNSGVQKNIIYGDFFFVEAILKLLDSDFLIW